MDSAERYTAKGERRLSLRGRDLAAVLCDCSAPVFTACDADIAAVVATVVRPLGISSIRVDTSGRREKVAIEPGMTAWDALQAVCELNGAWPWFTPSGVLVIGGPDYTTAPVGELVLDPEGDRTNVKSLTVTRDAAGLYSEVTVLGQSHGTTSGDGKHDIKAVSRGRRPDRPGHQPAPGDGGGRLRQPGACRAPGAQAPDRQPPLRPDHHGRGARPRPP